MALEQLERTRNRPGRGASSDSLLLIANLAGFLLLWEGLVRFTSIPPYILPAPSAIFLQLYDGLLRIPFQQGFASPASYYPAIFVTLQEASLGFLLGSSVGIAVALGISESRLLDRLAWPYIIGFQSLPKLALAPLFLIWFGHGLIPKVIMAAVLVVFPVIINTYSGLREVDHDRIDLARSFSASAWLIMTQVKFPSALPFIFAGLRLGAVYSLLGAVVGEFVGGQQGLGVRIMMMQFQMSVPQMFSLLIILSVLGWVLDKAISLVERRALFWNRGEF